MRRFLICIRRSARLCAACAVLVLGVRLSAQAPIERQPPSPPAATEPLPPVEWEVFESSSRDSIGSEITVLATPFNAHCVLDEVNPNGIVCHHEFRALPPFIPVLPERDFEVDRRSVREVWRPDRAASGWLGFGLGFGFGAGVYAPNHTSGDSAAVLILASGAIGAIGAYIGYHAPLIHHVLYRAR